MSKHTPGPWRAYELRDGRLPSVWVARELGQLGPDGQWYIAAVPEGDPSRNANANLIAAASELTTADEAQEFMRMYRAENKYADANIGYLSGYYGQKTMQRIQRLCGVGHPIFGQTSPTPEQAIEAGRKAALGLKT